MTSIYSAVNAASSASTTTTDSKVGKGMGAMDATDFMKLLTTQLTNQDPTAPMDNSQMLAQMAQFTSLSNSTEMNSTLKAIEAKLDNIVPADTSTPAA
jgi:flagellar basal-body rod modification protein FlgD